MKILEDLWHGYICPISEDNYRTHDYQYLAQKYESNEVKLLAELSDSQKEMLREMQLQMDQMRSIAECNAFITGFRLAVKLMAASV